MLDAVRSGAPSRTPAATFVFAVTLLALAASLSPLEDFVKSLVVSLNVVTVLRRIERFRSFTTSGDFFQLLSLVVDPPIGTDNELAGLRDGAPCALGLEEPGEVDRVKGANCWGASNACLCNLVEMLEELLPVVPPVEPDVGEAIPGRSSNTVAARLNLGLALVVC